MARVIVVSNRVALPGSDGANRAGGLEVALRAYLKRNRGLWLGWSGRVTRGEPEAHPAVEHGGITFLTADFKREDYEQYYLGFANRALWPILHYRIDLVEYSNKDLNGYLRVNDRFADLLHPILRPDDVIWVHDYHLLHLAKALRDRGHENRIGFFLHVPFPPPDVLAALPKHERLFSSLCHYDLIGFQSEAYAQNFSRYLAKECRMPSKDAYTFIAGKRVVRIGVFPVGVETVEFGKIAERATRSPFVHQVLASIADRSLIIGVDRLDYSKGIAQRLEAFERFLKHNTDRHGAVTYLQITPRSRSEIAQYSEMARQIGETVGRVNGAYGEATWTPIRYVNRAYSRSALAGLFRLSRAALVTPLRDGMNLVAKEYVAAQNPADPGVLILSRFAGAALECTGAILVNPYDTEAVGEAIADALAMPPDERRARHAEMIENLSKSDIGSWGDRFIGALQHPSRNRAAA